jgi:predicted CXXCH cytochrome family protein
MRNTTLLFAWMPFLAALYIVNQRNDPEFTGKVSTQQIHQKTVSPKCIDCHGDVIKKEVVHTSASESCENCHQINIKEHSETRSLGLKLSNKIPELCFSCHKGVKTYMDTIKVPHLALNNKESCSYCHSPHSSSQKKLLVSEGKILCLSCHNKDISESGKKILNIEKLLASNKVVHPAMEGGCSTCHKAHGSSNNYMLISAFPKGTYGPANSEAYAFCWECHDIDLFDVEKTTTSTNFRNGNINLHFVHRKGKKSRSCILCHNVHAAPNEHLIEDKVKFGEWDLPTDTLQMKREELVYLGAMRKSRTSDSMVII